MNALSMVKQYLCQLHFSSAFQDLRLSWLIGSSRSRRNLSVDCDSCREIELCNRRKCLINRLENSSLVSDSGCQFHFSKESPPIFGLKLVRDKSGNRGWFVLNKGAEYARL
jgi:hypothetical protein